MQMTYASVVVSLPSKYSGGDMTDSTTYWIVPVEVIWTLKDDNTYSSHSSQMQIKVVGIRDMELGTIQQKATELVKATFGNDPIIQVHYQ